MTNNSFSGSNRTKRPPIIDPVKRDVRQKCGFGCVICGKPLYEIDHIVPYASTQEHDPSNLVLLCVSHHREKTNGLLPVKAVRSALANPFNLQRAMSPGYLLHYGSEPIRMVLGSNEFVLSTSTATYPLVVDGQPLLGMHRELGHVLLTAAIFDDDNRLCVRIDHNELSVCTKNYDAEWIKNRLIIRQAMGYILLDVLFEPPERLVITRARLKFNGVQFLVRNGELKNSNGIPVVAEHCTFEDVAAGYVIGLAPPSLGRPLFHWDEVNRLVNAYRGRRPPLGYFAPNGS